MVKSNRRGWQFMGKATKRSKPIASLEADDTAAMLLSSVRIQPEMKASLDGEFCKMSDSPFYLIRLAANGKMKELEIHLMANPDQLHSTDCKGRSALHWAAKRGQNRVIEYILAQGVDINHMDKTGNTALHHAVDGNHPTTIDLLINKGADSCVRNNNNMAPIHQAVDGDQRAILQAMMKHDCVDVNQGGDNGRTPLHYAAFKNHAKCAHILLDGGALLCKKDDIGKYPVHLAAENGASGVLQILLRCAEKKGFKREGILKFLNQEKLTPLHAAVNSGDLIAVKTCLEAGSDIDMEQDDGSTAVHLAAAQGSVDMLKLMFSSQPDKKAPCVQALEVTKHTPLHKAALFDRPEAIKYLLQEGADIEAKDQDEKTPLLLAASKRAWRAVDCLIHHGASISQRDANNRNFLHLIIQGGGKPTDFKICFKSPSTKELLDEKDDNGSTPVHYASQGGQISTLNVLLELGALHNAKNNNMESPLHFAARYGRFNTCKRLLENSTGASTVNETDGRGHTPLHLAAQSGHTRVVALLLQHGAGLFRDLNGNTPLHLVAENGYSNTVREILNIHGHLINAANKDENTPLHLAAQNGYCNLVVSLMDMGAKFLLNKDSHHFMDLAIDGNHKDVATAIVSNDRWKEVMELGSAMFGCIITGTIQKMPDVSQMILDRCRIPSGPDCKAKEFHYTYNFSYLQANVKQRKQLKMDDEYVPLHALHTMVECNRVECLSHPVCNTYLQMKWLAFGLWFHLVNLVIYLGFLASLTAFVSIYDYNKFTHDILTEFTTNAPVEFAGVENVTNVTGSNNILGRGQVTMLPGQQVLIILILTFCALNAIKEVLQIFQQRWQYLSDPNNLLEWVLYGTSAAFVTPFLAGHSTAWQWQCGAVAIFLAWFNLLIFLQRFDFFGIYVVMFLVILKTLVQVLIVFSILIIAFAFTFFILMHQTESGSKSHGTPAISIVTTSIMMLGNIDYIDVWVNPYSDHKLPFDALSFIMLFVFILLMPILLINLLIGLAVGDIEAVQRDACLKRIAMQVQFISYIEARLPQRLVELVDQNEMKVYPNCSSFRITSVWHFITQMLLGTHRREESSVSTDPDMEHRTFLYEEMIKQKHRLKQMSNDLQKQYDLLRLVVQKMEIHTEADEVDQNDGNSSRQSRGYVAPHIGWSSPNLRQALVKQSVITKWGSRDDP